MAQTHDDEDIRLADVRADSRVVLVEFWASWCGPCRVEIPHMKEAYARYGDQGFEILSFTVDAEEQVWRDTNQEYELTWPDVSDQQALSSPIAIRYGATILPFNYLLDSDGRVLGKRLR